MAVSEKAVGCWELFLRIIADEVEMWRRVDEHLRRQLGISLVSLEALLLVSGGENRLDRLAEQLSTTTATLHIIVDELQRSGWCRVSSLTHARSAKVAPTPSGERVLIRSRAVVRREVARELRRSVSAGPLGGAAP